MKAPRPSAPARLAVGALRTYQFFSRFFPPQCRFYPSCSQYSVEAFSKYGFWRGLRLTAARLLRCHPWHPGGLDPVP
jgi:hypothetical protein